MNQEEGKAPTPSESRPPVFEKLGDTYRFTITGPDVTVDVENLHESKSGLDADVLVTERVGDSRRLLHSARWNLTAPQTRRGVAQDLTKRLETDWVGILENVCYLVRENMRQGEPTVDIRTVDPTMRAPWLLEPYIPSAGGAILFADGGTGKSMLAMAMAISCAYGVTIIGSPTQRRTPVLYLDWEASDAEHAARFQALCAGHKMDPSDCPIYYRRMYASLTESTAVLKREVQQLGIGLVIIDSLGAAAGGEPESADLAIRMMMSARSLGVPYLGVDHVTKAAGEGMRKQPFGSVYKHNLARVTWSAEKAQSEDDSYLTVLLRNQKANNGRLYRPLGLQIAFKTSGIDNSRLDEVSIRPSDVSTIPELAVKLPLKDRILNELKSGPLDMDELGERLGADKHQLRSRVVDLEKREQVKRLQDRRIALAG